MFKNLFIKSKKIISLFTLASVTIALGYILSQDDIIKNKINSLSNKFPIENIKEIEKEEGKTITKDYINILNKNFNDKLVDDNKDIAIITIDSNIKNKIDHAENVKGIIDTIIQKFKDAIDSFYLPYEEKDNGLQEIDYIESITNNIKDKIIFVNESFGHYIDFNSKDSFSFDSLTNFNQQIIDIKTSNNKVLSLLKDNPNIVLNKSAGNYIDSDNLNNRKELMNMFNILTKNNYEEIKGLVNSLNKIIINKIYNNKNKEQIELNKDEKDLLEILPKACKKLNIDYDNFISLYIYDYLIHYQKLDLLEKLNNKENKDVFNERNNPFGLQQITIIEAIDLNTINDNIKIFKKYHKDIDISKLEKEIKDLNLSNYKNYSLTDINKLNQLYYDYKNEYKEIFEFTTYGTLSNLIYKESNFLKTSIHGHNATGLDSAVGTSFAAPNYLGNYVNKYIETYKDNIKNMFISYYDKINSKIKGLDD